MNYFPETDDFAPIVYDDIPLIDVRAPVEFAAGAFPMSHNLPILDDDDRHCVGKCYKNKGKEAAFALAESRVSGVKRRRRIEAWRDFHKRYPAALLYCFRGGMRSRTAQEWLQQECGLTVPRLAGGYKAFRRFLLQALEPENVSAVPLILGGRTGSGKTVLLSKLKSSIDLEKAANHRGSTFGAHIAGQPSQIDFENSLAVSLLKHSRAGFSRIILEDEGHYIGARYIPHKLAGYFKRDSMVLLESDFGERVELTFKEYVLEAQREYQLFHDSDTGIQRWFEWMQSRVQRIRKRLGGERLARVQTLLEQAHDYQAEKGDARLHKRWIELLLAEYYDPMYDYQIKKSGRRIDFQGGFDEVLHYLRRYDEPE